jgi:hypothetical protein
MAIVWEREERSVGEGNRREGPCHPQVFTPSIITWTSLRATGKDNEQSSAVEKYVDPESRGEVEWVEGEPT